MSSKQIATCYFYTNQCIKIEAWFTISLPKNFKVNLEAINTRENDILRNIYMVYSTHFVM